MRPGKGNIPMLSVYLNCRAGRQGQNAAYTKGQLGLWTTVNGMGHDAQQAQTHIALPNLGVLHDA